MNFFENLILSLFDSCLILILIHSIRKSLPIKLLPILFYLSVTSSSIALIDIFVTNNVISHILSTIISIVALYCYLSLCGAKNKTLSLLIYFTVVLMILILQLITIIIMNMIMKEVTYTFQNGLISQITCLILVLILTKLIPFSVLNLFFEERNPVYSVIISTAFVLYYGITILWYIDVNRINTFILELFIMILLAVTINTVILREGFINRIYLEKLSIYDTYFPVIDDMIEEIRSKQHDYHNQLQTILSMKKNELTTDKDIEDYIEAMDQDNIWRNLLRLDNRIICAFLYSKLIECKNKDIHIHLIIRDYRIKSLYNTHQLVEMYGILIDNAIEAVEVMDAKKEIELYIDRQGDRNIFELRNPYHYVSVDEINNFFKNGYSTKSKSSRGIGLYKLKRLVESKNGTIAFSYNTALGQIIANIHYF